MLDNDEEDDDYIFRAVLKFISIIRQEQLSPVILPFEHDLFSELKKEVTEQMAGIKALLKNDGQDEIETAKRNFKYSIYNGEAEKVNYFLKMYLKIRLKKIQQYAFYLIKNPNIAQKRISNSEYMFLKKYAELRYRYYEENALKMIMKQGRGLAGLQIYFGKPSEEKLLIETKQSKVTINEPKTDQFCYAMILGNPHQYRYNLDIKVSNIPNNQLEVISANDIILGPYDQVSSKFKDDSMRLL